MRRVHGEKWQRKVENETRAFIIIFLQQKMEKKNKLGGGRGEYDLVENNEFRTGKNYRNAG